MSDLLKKKCIPCKVA